MTTATQIERSRLTGDWDIDPSHSALRFATKHAMVATVRGGFTGFSGTLHLDAEDPTGSTAEVTMEAASINTGSDQRDGHLRSADFFDVEQYPTITFTSSSAEVRDDDEFVLKGNLTIKGVSREVELELEYQGASIDPFGNLRAGFEGKTSVNRKDWGLTWNVALETGGFLVSDKVKVELDVSAVKRATKTADDPAETGDPAQIADTATS